MKYSTNIKPISYLKSHTAEIVREVSQSGEPYLFTQNGEAKIVIVDVRTYEENEQTLALLKILALGQKEIDQAQFRPAANVLADLEQEEQ